MAHADYSVNESAMSRSGGSVALTSLVTDVADAAATGPLFCVVIDLGDLQRSNRVPRLLGPRYTDSLVDAAEARIQERVGSAVRLHQVDAGCFAFVLPDDGTGGWQPLLESLVKALRQPFDCAGLPGAVEPCAGLVRVPSGRSEGELVLRAAMAAAQDARSADIAWRLQESDAEKSYHRTKALLAGLPVALAATDQLSLAYQPRMALGTGDCLGVEALLRWNHPTLGPVPPSDFIPLSEQTGMARFITTWVVDRALTDLAEWTAAGFTFGVSINISAVNLAEENFADRIAEAVRRFAVDPALVELEFTEGAMVRDSPRVRGTVAELAAIGVGISIDDFGTGYSNLQYLRDIPATTLKIDQSFIRSLSANARDPIIVRSMIDLAHALGYRVVAEGIEDDQAMSMLADWKCDEGQGYFISRPAPVAAMKNWVAARTGKSAAR
jgi:EAL domain-containing protein (putative c-di-GMP-specific phosphodiesterase class I)